MPPRTKSLPTKTAPADHSGPCLDTTEIRHLSIDLIDPNPWNPAGREQDPDLPGLADSICAVGVLQPLLVRPSADRFQLLVGRRRMLAAKLAGRTEVPVRVLVDVDDQLAEEITCIENLQRRNLHFLEEADGIAKLLRGSTLEALGARLGRPLSWISRRARLSGLSDRWKELIRDESSFAALWTASHCEAIALLEPPAQIDLLERREHSLRRPSLTVKELSRLIGDETRTVSTFPWRSNDADLDSQAGACCNCPCRSSQHPSLFEEPTTGESRSTKARVTRDDRCLDSTCAARKLALYLEREKNRLAIRHDEVLQVADGMLPAVSGAVSEWQLMRVTKTTAGAVPGLLVNGPQAGTVKWYRRLTASGTRSTPKAQPEKRSLADRRAQRERQRQARAIGTLQAEILKSPPPALAVVVRLAIVFGTNQSHRRSDHDADPDLARLTAPVAASLPPRSSESLATSDSQTVSEADAGVADEFRPHSIDLWDAFVRLDEAGASSAERCLWARVLPILILRMTPLDGIPSHVATAWCEAQHVGAILNLDATLHLQRAIEALPDPKSWADEMQKDAQVKPARKPPARTTTRATRSSRVARKRSSAA